MTTANESKLGGARGGHRGPIILRVAAARVLPLLPVAARGARLVLSMGLAACVCVCAGVSSIPESSQCVRVVLPGPARAGAGWPRTTYLAHTLTSG